MKMVRITKEVWSKDGDFYLSVTVIRRLAQRVGKNAPKRKKVRPKFHAPEAEAEPETEAKPEIRLPAVPEGSTPTDWKFDDDARTVDLGGGQMMKLGRIQYGLLKYIAQGGRSTQEAWETVWKYDSPVEWRTVKGTAEALNEKLGECKKVQKIEVSTREVKIFIS